jgi:hypothetical protein
MNKTAVDFMFQKLVLECSFSTSEIIYEQAKIMELEQITEAWKEGYDLAINGERIPKL